MKQKAFSIVFKGLSFDEKIKISGHKLPTTFTMTKNYCSSVLLNQKKRYVYRETSRFSH